MSGDSRIPIPHSLKFYDDIPVQFILGMSATAASDSPEIYQGLDQYLGPLHLPNLACADHTHQLLHQA